MSDKAPEDLILKFLAKLLKGTEYEGKTFLAGGAVRDEIMGKPIKDIDIVVSKENGGIEFANWITKKTGTYREGSNPVVYERFGTAKFNLNGLKVGDVDLGSVDIEVVMTRGEKYEKGSRKPEVVYADLKDDAFRRDLTVNSLFKDIVSGEIKDLTGKGLDDIKRGVVRTPTNPDDTFKDDPLRMLRVVRFAVKYKWKMPVYMLKALKRNSDMLKNISTERIRDELNKILMTDNPDIGLKLLTWSGLNKYVIPELDACKGVKQNEYHKHDVYEHILEVVKNTPPNLTARLASLMHDIGKPATKSTDEDGKVHFYGHEDVGADMAEDILRRLRYTNDEIKSVSNIVKNHMRLKQTGKDGSKASPKMLRKFVVALGNDLGPALKTMHADNISHKEEASMPEQIPNILNQIKSLKSDTNLDKPNLPVNGNDIMKHLNIKPGPQIKSYLDIVMNAWYKNPKIDKQKALSLVQIAHDNFLKKTYGDILDKKIKNPETGNFIKVKTALRYDDSKAVKKIATGLLKNK